MIVLLVDSTKTLERAWTINTVKTILGKCNDFYNLVLFGRHALPIVEQSKNLDIVIRVLEEAPFLPGIPEPLRALKQAIDIDTDLNTFPGEDYNIIMFWSMSKRPRMDPWPALYYLISRNYNINIISYRATPPKWITQFTQTYFSDKVKIYYKRPKQKYKDLIRSLEC